MTDKPLTRDEEVAALAPLDVFHTQFGDLARTEPQGRQAEDDGSVPQDARPGPIERSKHSGELLITETPRK